MRISDWSADVCSSDLVERLARRRAEQRADNARRGIHPTATPFDGVRAGVADKARRGIDGDRERAGADRHMRARHADQIDHQRSEERRVGKECVRKFISGLSTYQLKKKIE